MENNPKQKCIEKKTNTDKYIYWNLFALKFLYIGIFTKTVHRAHTVFSNQRYLDDEINHNRQLFHRVNGYPKRFKDSNQVS